MVVLVDEEDRENEGDLVFAADFVTPEAINFMAKHGRGLICMPITEAHAGSLQLAPMTPDNRSVHGTNFTVSIEAAEGVTTGISAADRARTVRVARRAATRKPDGHRPARAHLSADRAAGRRAGARRAHRGRAATWRGWPALTPAAVLCEIMNDDGTMARLPDLVEFARRARPEDRHDRRPDPVPQPHRAPGRAHRRAADHDRRRARSGWSSIATS